MATSEISTDYSETEAFKVFAATIWEQHKQRHPENTIDPTRFAEISTEKWITMTQEQKYAFFFKFQKDEERKVEQAKEDQERKQKSKQKKLEQVEQAKEYIQNTFRLFENII